MIGYYEPDQSRPIMGTERAAGRPSQADEIRPPIIVVTHMFELFAIVAVCGAAYLGLRRKVDAPVDRVDPSLWPYRHY